MNRGDVPLLGVGSGRSAPIDDPSSRPFTLYTCCTKRVEAARCYGIAMDQLLGYLGDLVLLGQQPIGLPELADDLLRDVAASLHGVLLPIGAIGLSYQADQSQGSRSHRGQPGPHLVRQDMRHRRCPSAVTRHAEWS
jgi:hypothetical protein